jgi:hypothetical protein
MRLLKVCPVCLGDMTVDAIPADVEGRCRMCGFRWPAEARSAGLARSQSSASMAPAKEDWPYGSRHVRRVWPRIVS